MVEATLAVASGPEETLPSRPHAPYQGLHKGLEGPKPGLLGMPLALSKRDVDHKPFRVIWEFPKVRGHGYRHRPQIVGLSPQKGHPNLRNGHLGL